MAEDYKDKIGGIELSDLLRTVRLQISDAMQEADGRSLQFELEKVELELKVEVAKKGTASTDIKFWVVSLGAKGEYTSSTSHTFKFTMKPINNNLPPNNKPNNANDIINTSNPINSTNPVLISDQQTLTPEQAAEFDTDDSQ